MAEVDLEYIAKREELIPLAEQQAYKIAGPRPKSLRNDRTNWSDRFNKAFHSTMDLLAKQAGI